MTADARGRRARLAAWERRLLHLAAEGEWPRVQMLGGGFIGPGRAAWAEVLAGWLQELDLHRVELALRERLRLPAAEEPEDLHEP